ncbi:MULTISPECIES: RagB/SusD family nutrient uptake outer membrane protein [Mangrovimonas]|uniref:RagB/SusD family nutrient uptake outer membrane protein n=1 Tax=Mangrovimonas TaxID=1211036 RepID=UPI0006B4C254|nr:MULTISPECIES: RagB/SusD family nutrient uptake outer membrane protein [Mangrovimonas]MCF1421567.1 RagB/SusD family nutrient uptake outer membrane protein [Mangrovimonas futianensis]NIK93524.1 RagB/SusD family nutrient uptake outer membrane protein [Mangrovimonas sp. CR14]
MKYFKHTLMICGMLLTFQACSDYVDLEASEVYQIDADSYFQSEANYQAALIGSYDPLQWLYLNTLIGDIASDNSFCGGESATDVIGLQQIDDMTHYPQNDNLTSIWRWCFEGVNRVNYMEENKNKIDFDGKAALYGEAYFLRSYYYFELVKFFGGVPLITDRRLDASDTGTLQRASKEEVYAQIEADLLNAIDVLPASQNQAGRVTKSAAQALLGKVYLYQDKFSEAASMLQNVIGLYSLVPDYGSQFLKSGENGPESVFEIQYSNESEWWDWGCPTCGEGNFGIIHNGPRAYSGPEFATGWSFNLPTPNLYNSFDEADSRRDASILDIEAWAAETGASYAEGYEHTGYYNRKYIPRAGESGAQTELNYLNNYRAIRYADVLLMAAEANARGGINEDLARNYLNQVRQRAFGNSDHNISTSGQALVQAIWNERNLELSMEGHRFFDLVRTGQAASVIDGFVTGKHELFPVPQLEVDISGLNQNPQY